jgi:acyl carrier protein
MDAAQRLLTERIISGLHLEDITVDDIDVAAPLFGAGLGLDSIDALELAVLVERHYGVRIPSMDVGKEAFASVQALDAYIRAASPPAP